MLSQFYRSSVAVIAPDLIQDLNLDAWELSTVSASFFYAFALMQIPVGIFLDSIGPRITMSLLTLVSVIGALIFSMGDSYYSLTLGRMLLGIGMACNFMGGLKLITLWFDPKLFATLSALIVSLGTAGNIAAATPLVLMVQVMGWRYSFMTMGGIRFLDHFVFNLLSLRYFCRCSGIMGRPLSDSSGRFIKCHNWKYYFIHEHRVNHWVSCERSSVRQGFQFPKKNHHSRHLRNDGYFMASGLSPGGNRRHSFGPCFFRFWPVQRLRPAHVRPY